MELRHIRYFIAVAEELHFGRAARRLHIAQPPLSQQIRQLEDELGCTLFIRDRHHVELSPAGELLLPQARILLQQAQACADVVRQSATGQKGVLVLGYVEEAVHFVFPAALQSFREQYPAVEVRLVEMHSYQQVEAVERGVIDFGFGYAPAGATGLAGEKVLSGEIELALPADHKLVRQRKAIKLEDCRDEPFIFPVQATSPQLYDFMLSICHSHGFTPNVSYTAEHIYTVMGLVRSGMGVTLFPGFIRRQEWPGVVVKPISGDTHRLDLNVIWNPRHAQWAIHQNFLATLRSSKKR